MKAPLWIVFFGLFPAISSASQDSYELVLKQYDAKNSSLINSEDGQIDGERYLAVITKQEMGQLLTVFRRNSTRYIGVAQAELPDSPTSFSTVTIEKNSIFVETSFCHHGCTDARYQFKKIDRLFKLVGVESHGETWCSYYDEKNAPADCNNSVRFGSSYNLLSSTSICWFEIEPEGKAPSKLPKQYQPRGVQHKMTFSKVDLPLLDGFNPDKFSLPKSCYFDYKKRVHVYTPTP